MNDQKRKYELYTQEAKATIHETFARIQTIANELLDAVAAKGEMDLVADFAFPLPTIVIAEMLGIPASDQDKFKLWTNAVVMPALEAEIALNTLLHRLPDIHLAIPPSDLRWRLSPTFRSLETIPARWTRPGQE